MEPTASRTRVKPLPLCTGPIPLPIFPSEAYNLIDNLLFLLADGDKEQKMNTLNFQGQMIHVCMFQVKAINRFFFLFSCSEFDP